MTYRPHLILYKANHLALFVEYYVWDWPAPVRAPVWWMTRKLKTLVTIIDEYAKERVWRRGSREYAQLKRKEDYTPTVASW